MTGFCGEVGVDDVMHAWMGGGFLGGWVWGGMHEGDDDDHGGWVTLFREGEGGG